MILKRSAILRLMSDVDDYLARGEDERVELIRGAIVDKQTSVSHSRTQVGTTTTLKTPFGRKPGGGSGPGGWWFFTELEVRFAREVFRPDVCAYRRDRMPQPPKSPRLVELPPDWVCEILSPGHERRDRVEKLQTYFKHRVPHYWIIDPIAETLEVFRRVDLGYTLVLTAVRGQRVRAEPFDELEVRVDELLGDDPE
jgi:Uma2 family endonuclease